jgi:DNA-binding CsgD family transcriptional regulator
MSCLLGRHTECERLDSLLEALRRGESQALVLHGEAGIGKTALLGHSIHAASELNVVEAVGVESDMELAYASLHQLCGPLLQERGELSAPQREALEIVFGLKLGAAPDRFLVCLAVLSLLSEAAKTRPLLCVVDDAHWLDRVSAVILAFVARRLQADRVGFLFAAREPDGVLAGLPALKVGALHHADARALFGSVVPFGLDDEVRDRIVAEAQGNPHTLLELSHGFSPNEFVGGLGLLGGGVASRPIEESFMRRVEALGSDARRLLLIAAAEPVGDPRLLSRAVQRLGIPFAAAETATCGLLELGSRVTFRHPLLRSTVYRSASMQERRAAHLALAEATDERADPDRRAWHLAAAATGPDEPAARELERSAGRAGARGGIAAAAAFLQRSVALTDVPAHRTERALAAAQESLRAGALEAVSGLLATAGEGSLDELQRTRIGLLLGQAAFASRQWPEAQLLLLRAAKGFERLDAELARTAYLDAWGAAALAGRVAGGDDLLEVSRAAIDAPAPPGPPRPSDLLLDGLATLIVRGRSAAVPILREACRAATERPLEAANGLSVGWVSAACTLWDDAAVHQIAVAQVEASRRAGALTRLPLDLNALAVTLARAGDFTAARQAAAEARTIARIVDVRVAPYGAGLLAALGGREADAVPLLQSIIVQATADGNGDAVVHAHWMSAVLFNGLGRCAEAMLAAEKASGDCAERHIPAWALAELIEAAVRSGNLERVTPALEALGRAVAATPDSDWARGLEARSRALSDRKGAEPLFLEAIARLQRTRLRPELGRTHLLYGEWLRRESRRVAAREELRAAHQMFLGIGMEAFAERARVELLATGEKVRQRGPDTRDDLTEQEFQIAGLALDGLTNPEIGARLFLSPRTVEWHLRKVFGKLGIRSRRDLGRALPVSRSGVTQSSHRHSASPTLP